MQSIIDILHKNFQEDHTNSRRFPGFPGVVDTLFTLENTGQKTKIYKLNTTEKSKQCKTQQKLNYPV